MNRDTRTFWELLDNPVCGRCGKRLVQVSEDCFFCEDGCSLSLCGYGGHCEGIAYNYPLELVDGELVEVENPPCGVGGGYCDLCDNGWEWA